MRLIACAVLMSAGFLHGAAKPDFSGDWVLNLSRSELEGQTPKKLTQNIVHHDPSLKLSQTETSLLDKDVKFETTYSTDGKEVTNDMLGSAVKSVAKWDGDELVINWWTEIGGRKIMMKDRWRLTENGTTLVVQRDGEGFGGKVTQTLVMDKVVDKEKDKK